MRKPVRTQQCKEREDLGICKVSIKLAAEHSPISLFIHIK